MPKLAASQRGAAEIGLGEPACGEIETGQVAKLERCAPPAWPPQQESGMRREDAGEFVGAHRVQLTQVSPRWSVGGHIGRSTCALHVKNCLRREPRIAGVV